jgi:MFS family permease
MAPLIALYVASPAVAAIQSTVVLAHVFAISRRELDLGLVGLAEFVPSMLLVLVTGSVADHFDRRKVILVALTCELLCLVALAWYASTDPTSVVPIFGIVAAYGASRAFAAPAVRSLAPDIAPEGSLQRVIAIQTLGWQGASIVAPIAGGFLFAVSPTVGYLGGIVLMFVAIGCALALPSMRRDHGEPLDVSLSTALAGLRVVRRSPILGGAITLDLFAVLFGGAVALIPAIATDRLGVGPEGQGLLRAAAGAGAAVCAAFLAARPFDSHIGRRLFAAVAVFGAGTIVLGLTREFVVALVAMAVLSAADMVSVYIRLNIVPLATPPDARGRVLAVEQVFIGASNELGAFQSGVAAALLGTAGAVVSGGAVTIAVAAACRWIFPALWRVNRFAEVEP